MLFYQLGTRFTISIFAYNFQLRDECSSSRRFTDRLPRSFVVFEHNKFQISLYELIIKPSINIDFWEHFFPEALTVLHFSAVGVCKQWDLVPNSRKC